MALFLHPGGAMSVSSIDGLFLRVIREVELFKQLGRDDLSMLLRQAAKASFAAGEVVYEEGSEGQCMYVVVQGRFEVYRHANGSRMHLADVLPGEHFGEIALLGNGVRSASVMAVTGSVALGYKDEHCSKTRRSLCNCCDMARCLRRGSPTPTTRSSSFGARPWRPKRRPESRPSAKPATSNRKVGAGSSAEVRIPRIAAAHEAARSLLASES